MEKKSFDFYQDVKVTIWQRQHFSIEAESREEAIAIAKGYSDSDVSFNDEVEVNEVEWLYDTEEHITPEKNGGSPTIEVYEYISKYNSPLIADNFNPSSLPAGVDLDKFLYKRLVGMYRDVVVEENPLLTYEDRLWETAHGLCMENIAKLEAMYPELKDEDEDGECWYDSVREDVILNYSLMMDVRLRG